MRPLELLGLGPLSWLGIGVGDSQRIENKAIIASKRAFVSSRPSWPTVAVCGEPRQRWPTSDVARWRQGQIVERASDEAIAAGYDEWRIFDVDERELAQEMTTDQWVEQDRS